jgi:hypothetical protein
VYYLNESRGIDRGVDSRWMVLAQARPSKFTIFGNLYQKLESLLSELPLCIHTPISPYKMSAEASSSTSNAHASVLMPSEDLPEDAVHIKGPDLSNPITLEELLKSYNTIGFQATGLSRAIQIVEEMVHPPCTDVGEAYM